MTFEMVQQPHDKFQVESPVLAVCRMTEPSKVTGVAAERRHHGIRADRLEGLAEARVADLVTEEVTPEATDHQEDHQARLGDPTDRRMVGPGGLRMGAPAAVDRLGDLARCADCITSNGVKSVSYRPAVAVEAHRPADPVDPVGPVDQAADQVVMIPVAATAEVRSTIPTGSRVWASTRTLSPSCRGLART